MNTMPIAVQGPIIQGQQPRSHSLSPIEGFSHQNINQNQRVMVQSPPPYNMHYSFGAPHQNIFPGQQSQSIIQIPGILNQPIQKSVQGTLFQPVQTPVHYMPHNNMNLKNPQIVRGSSPSIGTTGISNMIV
jgi:hypothetical protein